MNMKTLGHPDSLSHQAAEVCADVPAILDRQDGCFAGLLATDKKTARCGKEIGEKAPMMKVWGRNPGNGLLVDEAIAATPRSTTRTD